MDNVGWDFVVSLHPDIVSKILTCLDDPGDIVRASSVSRAWRDFGKNFCDVGNYSFISNGICKLLCLRLFPQLSCITHIGDTSSMQQQKCSDVGSSKLVELDQSKKAHAIFASLARGLTSSDVDGECLSDAIGASSTDNYPEESIHNTLEPRDRIGRNASYWSSTGQSNPEVLERLTYQLVDLCVITEINIQPFQAFFQAYSPIYSAKAVRFRTGYKLSANVDEEMEEMDILNNHGGPYDDEHFVWTYTSIEFPMAQENRLQNFKLPDPVLCIGGILQIELLGRVQRQEMDGLFYLCVAHVQVLGHSLTPPFTVDRLEPPGTFLLTFHPHNEFHRRSIIPMMLNSQIVQPDDGDWEHILNMLHGVPGVEVYDSEDEHHDSDDDDVAF